MPLHLVVKIFFIVLLSLTGTYASATWVRVANNDIVTGYVNPTNITRTRQGDRVRVWELIDYKTAQNKNSPYLSTMGQTEYDCTGIRLRILSLNAYAGKLAKGEIVNAVLNKSPDWTPVSPGGVTEVMWKVACNGRRKVN
jgi:hypothetical protein